MSNEYYNKLKSETEQHLIALAKLILGISGAALTLTIGAVLNSKGLHLTLCGEILLKTSWVLFSITMFCCIGLIGVVIASTLGYMEKLRIFNPQSSDEPEYPEWNEKWRGRLSILGLGAFSLGVLCLLIAILFIDIT